MLIRDDDSPDTKPVDAPIYIANEKLIQGSTRRSEEVKGMSRFESIRVGSLSSVNNTRS